MVFTNKKYHLNLNCLTSGFDRNKFDWQCHCKIRYLHRITFPLSGLPSIYILDVPALVFSLWLWSSFSIVPFVTCNILSLLIDTQKFRVYVTPPYLNGCLFPRFERLIFLSDIIFTVLTSPVFNSQSVWRFSSSSVDVAIGR